MDTAPGTIVVWSDLTCLLAHGAVARLHRVRFDDRASPLDSFDDRPAPGRGLTTESPLAGAVQSAPGAP